LTLRSGGGPDVRRVPWWAMVSSSLALVFLVGGWTVAAAVQPAAYDPFRDTISALAGHDAAHRWIMTVGLAGVGICHLATAAGLRPARAAGRITLGLGGAATLLVAASPLPHSGGSQRHGVAAALAFVALALWPLVAAGRAPATPWTLRPVTSLAATTVLLGLLGWFAIELSAEGTWIGATERAAAAAQAIWPLVVVTATRTADRSAVARSA
jgi:hypothetical membrane protein